MKLTAIIDVVDKARLSHHNGIKVDDNGRVMILYQSQTDFLADFPDDWERDKVGIEKGWLFEPSALDTKVKTELQTDIGNLSSIVESIINEWEQGGEAIDLDELKHIYRDITEFQKKFENI